jgi:hypothetical protein
MDSVCQQPLPPPPSLLHSLTSKEVAQEASGALRVHAMMVRRAPNMAGSPYDGLLLKRSLEGDLFSSMRSATIEWLARPLGGDLLAAELLLLQLTARCAL